MDLIIYFKFETQIKYMWWLENFKVSEILHVTTFYIFILYIILNSQAQKLPRQMTKG
jgi:hypothetical protein